MKDNMIKYNTVDNKEESLKLIKDELPDNVKFSMEPLSRKLEDLCDDSNLSVCSARDALMSDSDYYCYQYATPEEKIEMKKYYGFCAGSFGFKNPQFLSDMRKLIEPKLKNPSIPDGISRKELHDIIIHDAILDQTSLNYWIFKRLPDLKYYDFCNIFLLSQKFFFYLSYNFKKTIYLFIGIIANCIFFFVFNEIKIPI